MFTVFVFGIAIGSFINVVVGRTRKEGQNFEIDLKSLISSRSYCDFCKRQLVWWENIPLLSFIILGCKCRTCKKKIPLEYFLVELTTGLVFVAVTLWFMPQFNFSSLLLSFLILGFFLTIALILILIFLIDWHFQIIPDLATLALIILSLLGHFFDGDLSLRLLIAPLLSFLFLFLIHLFTKRKGMGFGDVKFAIFMGLFLGGRRVVLAFYIAVLTGALIGVILILSKKKKFGQKIAFGPFLVLGTFTSWLFGNRIIDWLLSFHF